MISVNEAISILSDSAIFAPSETVSIEKSLGRVTAKPIAACVTLPPNDASAMDGYAVKLQDVKNAGSLLRIIGEAPAGRPFSGELKSGETVRLFTGSRIPDGADHVVIQENTERNSDQVEVKVGAHSARHIRRAGIDFKKGDLLIPAGREIGPPEIALAAAANHAAVTVRQRPRIAFISSGDELISPGTMNTQGKVISSNPSTLSALVEQWGGIPVDAGLAKDSILDISACIEGARDADIIVPIGGASVGNYDLMRQAFIEAGAKMIFEKIAVKPGKPTWFAKLGNTPVLGLPGNPASAIVCAHLFLRILMNTAIPPVTQAQLHLALPDNGPRESYLRGRAFLKDGRITVVAFPRQDSSLLVPFRDANVLIKRHSNMDASKAGDVVEILALNTGPSILEPFDF